MPPTNDTLHIVDWFSKKRYNKCMNSTALTTQLDFSPVGNLDAYIRQVFQAPILSAEEEQALAQRMHKENDLFAAKTLIVSHLRFVVHLAYRYKNFGLPMADLIQEGTVGLMKAVKRFDPKAGARLATFAMQWIKSEIYDFVLRNWRIVKIATTKAQRKLFTHINNRERLSQEDIQLVAQTLDVKEREVKEMLIRLDRYNDIGFDHQNTEEALSPSESLSNVQDNPAQQVALEDHSTQNLDALHNALEKLDTRSQAIIKQRWLNDSEKKTSLNTLAKKFGLSIERTRPYKGSGCPLMRLRLDMLLL